MFYSTDLNSTFTNLTYKYDYEMSCGSNNCPQTPLNVLLSKPTQISTYILFASMSFLILTSMLCTLIFTDNLNYRDNANASKERLTLKVIGKKKSFLKEFYDNFFNGNWTGS